MAFIEYNYSIKIATTPGDKLMKSSGLGSFFSRSTSLVALSDERCVSAENDSILNTAVFFLSEFMSIFEFVQGIYI